MRVSSIGQGLLAGIAALAIGSAPAARAGDIVDEVKLGVLAADIPVFAPQVENGTDINGELLFKAPQWFVSPEDPPWLRGLLAPRPTIGFTVNTAGGTDFFDVNLNWSWTLARDVLSDHDGIYASFEVGGAYNTSDLDPNSTSNKDMGSHGSFHLAAELGYDIDRNINVSLYFEHFSNAGLASPNPGMNNAGARLGYRF